MQVIGKFLKHSTKCKARYRLMPHRCGFWAFHAGVLDRGRKVWLHLFPASCISESAWSCFATKLHKWKPSFLSSLTMLVFSLISHYTPSSDSIVCLFVFSTLHTFPGCKRAWTMNIYQHDLWFVSRFEYQMLLFQAPRLNSSQTKIELYSKAHMRNKPFHGISKICFPVSSFIKHNSTLNS